MNLDDRVKKLIKVLTLIEKGKEKEAEELIGDDAILRTCVELVSPCLSEIIIMKTTKTTTKTKTKTKTKITMKSMAGNN
jgi:hypothetical protein